MKVARWAWVLLLATCVGAGGQAVQPLGEYAAMKQDAEHCNGYAVDLWRSGSTVVGAFKACAGLVGDVPEGSFEDASYDARTGKVRFTARLSLGSDYVGAGKQIASKDVYTFVGRMVAGALRGVLTHVDEAEAGQRPETNRLVLRRRQVRLKRYETVEAWWREHSATPR